MDVASRQVSKVLVFARPMAPRKPAGYSLVGRNPLMGQVWSIGRIHQLAAATP